MKGFKFLGLYIPDVDLRFLKHPFVIYTVVFFTFSIFAVKHLIEPETRVYCKVLTGYQTSAAYKVSEKFILILEDPKHRQFDLKVTPLTFYKATTNGHITLMLTDSQITKERGGTIRPLLILFLIFGSALWVAWGLYIIFET